MIRALGSVRFTLVLLGALAAGVVALLALDLPPTWCVAAPLFALTANLLAAVATNPAFRRQGPLLAFHLALAAVAALAAIGRLTYLQGGAEVTSGQPFTGEMVGFERGPLHRVRLAEAAFVNAGFEIDYAAGLRRGPTRNLVRWTDEDGVARRAQIGDQDALVLRGYRFYTTSNKGFAPRLVWTPAGGAPHEVDLHMPSYPVFQFGQELEWNLPRSGTTVKVSLQIDEDIIDPEKASRFRVPARQRLRIEGAGAAAELRPGESMALGGGTLAYVSLGSWMGYKVSYDWTLPWIFAAAATAALALAAHFAQRWRARPWDVEPA